MSLESGNFIKDLITTNPEGTDPKSQGDDHLRLIKNVLRQQFSGFTQGIPITKTESQINAMLLAGAFGLGGACITLNESQINDADIGSGFYYVVAQASGFLPIQANCYMLYVDNPVAGFAARWFIPYNTGTTYMQVKTGGTWQSARLYRDLGNSPAQVDMFDTGGGCMLTPGSFGLGVTQPAGTNANIANAPFANVTYNGKWFGASWVGQPPAESAATPAILTLEVYSSVYQIQTFQCLNNGNKYTRYCNAGTWSNFVIDAIVTQQSSASPGYQVINRICRQWGVYGTAIAAGSSAIITFPLAFTTVWSVNANLTTFSGNNTYGVNIPSITNSNFTAGYYSTTASPSGSIFWQAVGLV